MNPSVNEAMEFAVGRPADCHADRCLVVLAEEVLKLRAALVQNRKYLRAANRGAERNAIVSQLLAARQTLQRHVREKDPDDPGSPIIFESI